MPVTTTANDRDELDRIWHQLTSSDSDPDLTTVLQRAILVTRGLLRRIDELQAEVNRLNTKETGK